MSDNHPADLTIHEFAAQVTFDPDVADGYMKHYVPIPAEVAAAMENTAASRVNGRLDGHRFQRALHRRDDGSLCLKFGQSWLRDAGIEAGVDVDVVLSAVTDPNQVDIPDELAAALEGNPEAAHAWETLTPGRRRSLVYGIERARRPETKARRAQAVVDEVCQEFGLM